MLVVLAAAGPAMAEMRMALVIGNSGYKTAPLTNPRNDAELMARGLKAVGFDVVKVLDADQKTMRRALLDFARRQKQSDTVALIYYAGHGVQVDGENFLIPVGADIKESREIAVEGVNFSEFLKALERSGSRLGIAILDACRDNPFAGDSRGGPRGLVGVTAGKGTLIAYATAPGEVARDGEGANSPYTTALAQSIREVGLPIEAVFKRTRQQVLEVTQNKQTPWEASSLVGDFYFRPKRAEPEASVRPSAGSSDEDQRRLAEINDWQAIKGRADRAAFERHIAKYPDGVFAEVARLRIAEARTKPAVQTTRSESWPWSPIETASIGDENQIPRAASAYEQAVRLDQPGASAADLAEAVRLYVGAADEGILAAMVALGRAYGLGRGVGQDHRKAADWYARAGERGSGAALAALGAMTEFGDGVTPDLVEALHLYRLAAEQGDPQGMTSLAFLHASGKGVVRDLPEARRWYTAAAERGAARAMFNLALMLVAGEGGTVDRAQALIWLEKAAALNHGGALRELAYRYDEGRGVRRDPKRAGEFLLRAYKAGNPATREELIRRPAAWTGATRVELQRQLTASGAYQGRAHGLIDKATRAALETVAAATPRN